MSTQVPAATASLPEDQRNTARETRARYRYQDECVALALLKHLESENLDGVLIEHSTDLILLPANGIPELVSIKHREPNQSGEPGWSWSALKRQRVLIDLYDAWTNADRRCTLAFWTNAGFNGSAHRLWQVCARQAEPTQDLVRSLKAQLGVSDTDAEEFLHALRIPEDPLPRRKEITDVGLRRTTELARKYRPDFSLHAEECYRALIDRIAQAGTDVPEAEALPQPIAAATLAAAEHPDQLRVMRRFLPARQLLDEILSVHDRLAAAGLPDAGQHGWEPDAQFIGRSDLLETLADLLRPGLPLEVPPVVIHGIPGCGKTSLAAQFAATHKSVIRPVFISAPSRGALIGELAFLANHNNTSNWDAGIAQLHGPVTPQLPGNSATLLIVDGVTEVGTIRGIVPRKSLCRVIITSNISYLEQGYKHVELNGWRREESHKFIRSVLNEVSPEDSEQLASALHDHPLALTQAVNYCRAARYKVINYLERLAKEPLAMLDRGQASGHIESVMKTITINIDAVNNRFERCTELLYLFSHLGSSPINESILDGKLALTYVIEPKVQLTPAKNRWRFAWKRPRKGYAILTYGVTQRGNELFVSLCDREWREKAIEALILSSLISRRDEGLVVHPLVALTARSLAGDPKPWVEVGLGLFASHMEQGGRRDFTTIDPYIDHIAALGSTAIDAGLSGPAVLAVCQVLSFRLAMFGVQRYGNRTAVEFGRRAVQIAEESLTSPGGSVRMLAQSRASLALALWEAGFVNDAIALLRENLQLGVEHDLDQIYVISMLDLGLMIADVSELGLVQEVLDQLNVAITAIPNDFPVQLASAWHVKTRLLRRLGRIEDARRLSEKALALARETPTCPERVLAELHSDSVLLTRDMGDPSAAYHYARAALDISRRRNRERLDLMDMKLLIGTADAAIDDNKLNEAEMLIDEAERIGLTEFGRDSTIYAHVLAERGRLRLVKLGNGDLTKPLNKQELTRAFTELERAVEVLEQGSVADESQLPSVLVHLAQVAHLLGDGKKARLSIEHAYNIDLKFYGPDHPETRKDRDVMKVIQFGDLIRGGRSWNIGRSEKS
jgi:tetratricopeptide (TPR) repeat protein